MQMDVIICNNKTLTDWRYCSTVLDLPKAKLLLIELTFTIQYSSGCACKKKGSKIFLTPNTLTK